MPKSLARRSKSNLARRGQRKMMRRKRLHQSSLPVGAGSKHRALHGVRASPSQNHIDRAMHTRVFPRRSSRLHRVRHFRQLALLLLLRQWADIFLKMFFRGRHGFHDLAVEQSPQGPYVGNLGMILEPNSVRSEEHTSELQSLTNLVCRLLLEKKKKK